MAEAVARGAGSVNDVQVHLIALEGKDIVEGRYKSDTVFAQLDASDAIIFGSPTYMGGPAAQFKAFADTSSERWMKAAWKDKLAAGFTVSGSPSGDKQGTLHYFMTLALQHCMVWIGVAESPYNEAPEEAPNEADKLTGESLGRRVAQWAQRLP